MVSNPKADRRLPVPLSPPAERPHGRGIKQEDRSAYRRARPYDWEILVNDFYVIGLGWRDDGSAWVHLVHHVRMNKAIRPTRQVGIPRWIYRNWLSVDRHPEK